MLNLRCFHWMGSNKKSLKTTGTIYAYSHAQLQQLASESGIKLAKVVESKVSAYYQFKQGIKTEQISEFIHQLSTLLESGFSLSNALQQLHKEEAQTALNIFIHQLRSDILAGQPLSNSLSQFHFIESSLIEYVRLGESNGQLVETLNWAMEQRERKSNIKRKLRSALIYPVIILSVATSVLLIMLLFVLPQFESLFIGFGAELPKLTQITLSLSDWVQQHILTVMALFFSISWGIFITIKLSSRLTHQLHQWLLYLPIIGSAIQAGEWAKFSLILSSSLKAGVPIITAWDNALTILNNRYLRCELRKAKNKIENGTTLSQAIQGIPTLPHNLGMIIHVGESSGRLVVLLERASQHLEQQLINTTDQLGKLLEPIIILLLGGMVGTLVLSIYLPIFSLMNSLH